MQVEIVVLLAILIFLLIAPIYVKIRLGFDVIKNIGEFAVYIFGIKIIKVKIRFTKNSISVITSKKQKDIPLDLKNKQVKFFNNLMYNLFLLIIVLKLRLYFEIGKNNDAFYPAMICGLINCLVGALLGYCYTKKGVFNTSVDTILVSNNDKIDFSFQLNILFNLLVVIISFVRAKIKQHKEVSYAR